MGTDVTPLIQGRPIPGDSSSLRTSALSRRPKAPSDLVVECVSGYTDVSGCQITAQVAWPEWKVPYQVTTIRHRSRIGMD